MKSRICLVTLAAIAVIATRPAPAQQPAPGAASQGPVVKSTVDEVVLDFIARDKKGKAAEHLLLSQTGSAGDEPPDPIGEFLVIGHPVSLPSAAAAARADRQR